MKKKLQKVFAMLLALSMVMSLVSVSAFAADETYCGYTMEHTHTEECYAPACTLTEGEGHTHSDDSCYTDVDVLTCTLEESEEHTHGEECYTAERQLSCGEEEWPAHTHTAECLVPLPSACSVGYEHTHMEDCYAPACTLTEGEGHTHSDDTCYTDVDVLTCTLEESEEHTHGEECYTAERQLSCGEEEQPAHTHTEEHLVPVPSACPYGYEHTHTEECYAPVCTCGNDPHTADCDLYVEPTYFDDLMACAALSALDAMMTDEATMDDLLALSEDELIELADMVEVLLANELDVAADDDAINVAYDLYDKITANLQLLFFDEGASIFANKSEIMTLKDALNQSGAPGNIEIRTLPATLYNYTATTWNKNTSNYKFRGRSGLDFADPNRLPYVGDNGLNGGGGYSSTMGILEDSFDDKAGWPLLKVENGNAKNALFRTDTSVSGRTVYDDLGMEFVYDTSTGYYTYNSRLNHAQLNNSTIELYNAALSPLTDTAYNNTGWEEKNGWYSNGGFYPFDNISNAYPATNALLSWSDWLTNLYNPDPDSAGYAQMGVVQAVNKIWTDWGGYQAPEPHWDTWSGKMTEMHFGMELDTYFYLPSDKQSNGQDMIFSFAGDDDVWVFVDGQLVLDVGGGHSEVGGSINFKTGEVKLDGATVLNNSNYNKSTNVVGKNADGTYIEGTGAYSETSNYVLNLAENTTHHLQVFYLERYSGDANCFMSFNLPILPENSITVEKSVEGDDYSTLTGTEYSLQLLDSTGNAVTASFTDENGIFTLERGEKAEFTGISTGTYYVRELLPVAEADKYSVSIDGSAVTAEADVVTIGEVEYYAYNSAAKDAATGSLFFHVKNTLKTGDLKITKEAVGNTTPANTSFTVTGPNGFSKTVKYSEFAEGACTIKNLPLGTYTVTEDTTSADVPGYTLVVTGNGGTATVTAGGTAVVALTNTYTEIPTYTVTYVVTGEDKPAEDKTDPVPGPESGIYAGTPKTVKPALTTTDTTKDGKNGTWFFSGWSTADATVTEGSFTMPAKDVVFTGSWIFRELGDVTVNHYRTKTHHDLVPVITHDNDLGSPEAEYLGETYTAHPVPKGYVLTKIEVDGVVQSDLTTPVDLVVSKTGHVINFYYELESSAEKTSWTVKHIYKDYDGTTGQLIGEPREVPGVGGIGCWIGETKSVTPIPDGYTLESVTFNGSPLTEDEGKYSAALLADPANNVFILVYSRVNYTLTVKHVDASTGELLEPATVTSAIPAGTPYSTSAKSFSGYRPGLWKADSDAVSGEMNSDKTVVYEYTKNPPYIPPTYTLTVNYVDTEGNVLHPQLVTSRMAPGSAYTTEQKTFEGYSFVETTGDAVSGIMNGNKTVTYIYTPIEDIPDEDPPLGDVPDDVEELPEEDIPLADVPATGDATGLWLALSAISGSGLIGLNLMGRKKREDEE